MLLALWSDFWNPAVWVPPGPQPQLPDGGSRDAGHGDIEDYAQYSAIPDSADESYWREREIYLRRNLPVDHGVSVKREAKGKDHSLQPDEVAQEIVIPGNEKLLSLRKKLDDLTLQMSGLQSDSDEEAIALLLLS